MRGEGLQRLHMAGASISTPYIALLAKALEEEGPRVVMERRLPSPRDRDPVWIQWPVRLRPQKLDRIETWLDEAAAHRVIIWTVHEIDLHVIPRSEQTDRLFEMVASRASVHVHHGRASVEAVSERFPHVRPLETLVIQPGGFDHLPGLWTREEARRDLGLDPEEPVIAVVGQVRTADEWNLIRRVASASDWTVLCGGLQVWPRTAHLGHRLRWRVQRMRLGRKLRMFEGWIPDWRVEQITRAADALLIPRPRIMNSGNVMLGFTGSLPVIGPDRGNVGEVLRETGNLLFDPDDADSIMDAVRRVGVIDRKALGERNRRWLEKNGDWRGFARTVLDAIDRVER